MKHMNVNSFCPAKFGSGNGNTCLSISPPMAVWRNGSASDYESGGCSFEYYLGHTFSLKVKKAGYF